MDHADRHVLGFLLERPRGGVLDGRPVASEALRQVVEVARHSGSSGGRRPWEFVVLEDRTTIEALADAAPEAGALRGAPAVIVIVMPGDRVALDAYDEGRAAERILLAARALGLAGRIGWVLADRRDEARRLLGLADDRLVRTTIAIGAVAEPH